VPDVIVIGVGPAGANAARFAAREGLDVLAVDQRQEIGAPKRCAEGVVLEVLKRDMVPEDERWIAQRIHGLTFVAPNGRRVSAREDHVVGVVVERKLFDKYLATLAVRDGANVQAWTRAESVVRDGDTTRVTLSSAGRTWEEEAAIVICCGGVDATMARSLGLTEPVQPKNLSSGVQFEMAGIDIPDPTMVTCWTGRRTAGGGYAWVFPKGDDVANVGVTVLGSDEENSITYLKRFIASEPGLAQGSVLEVNAGTIPVGESISHFVADGIMVAGDAARQVNPIHAGGICEAMEAGRFAGETAAKAIGRGDTSKKSLKEYEERWSKGYGAFQNSLVRARRAVHSLSDEDLDYLITKITPKDVVDFLAGKGFTRAARLFARRPSLLKVFLY